MGKIQYYAMRNAGDPQLPKNDGEKDKENSAISIGKQKEDIPWQRKEYLLFDLEGTLIGIEENGKSEAQIGLYRGMPEMLEKLNARGLHMGVISDLPASRTEELLVELKLRKYFEFVVGSEKAKPIGSEKANQILESLHKFFPEGKVEKDKIYVIGDTVCDIEGAKLMGLESVGVSYGQQTVAELMGAHAEYIVRSVEELRRFLLRGYEDMRTDLTGFQKVWILLSHYVIFAATKGFVYNLLILLLAYLGTESLTKNQNANAVLNMVGFFAAGAVIFKPAKGCIKRTLHDMYLTHLKSEPKVNYWLLVIAGVGLSQGISMFLGLAGIAEMSVKSQEVLTIQRNVFWPIAIISYGLISPVAEELLFRGIIYGYLRKLFDVRTAIVASAILFGMYHGNMVQTLYATIMGYMIAYAYEYFGSFKVPLCMHIGFNLLSLFVDFTGVEKTSLYGWPLCGGLLLIGMVPMVLLARKKRIM